MVKFSLSVYLLRLSHPNRNDYQEGMTYHTTNLSAFAVNKSLFSTIKLFLIRRFWNTFVLQILPLINRRYFIFKSNSTGDIYFFSLLRFDEFFLASELITELKNWHRVWYKDLSLKFISFRIIPSLCDFLFDYLSCQSVAAMLESMFTLEIYT